MINELFLNEISNFGKDNVNIFNEKYTKSYESECTKFYNELKLVVKYYDLGNNITIKNFYDESICEKLFIIKTEPELSESEKYSYLEKITSHMNEFSRANNIFNFYLDAYISIE